MSNSSVDQIANAILYEGYILYPYRASATKNRQRFTFGRIYPQAYSSAQNGAEPCSMQTQCLVRTKADRPRVRVRVRFLQPIAREVGRLPEPTLSGTAALEAGFEIVPELLVEGRLYQTWHEAAEREMDLDWQPLHGLARVWRLQTPAAETLEPIPEGAEHTVGIIRRRQFELSGEIEVSASPLNADLFRLTVRVQNHTPVPKDELANPDAVLLRTLASAHTILQVEEGEFVSLLDPAAADKSAVAECKNVGTWPVLVGDEQARERTTMLSSPIILYDYPRLAPESPGDLCDGTEIDEILSLRIQTMTDQEKWEMNQVDSFARRILERTEGLSEAQYAAMHGSMRPMASFDEQVFNQTARLDRVCVEGVFLKTGDRVRIHPKNRADVMDLALAGKAAVIEAIEQDAEARVHLALVIEDDPGKDLGMLRQPGHRFFYSPEEVVPLVEASL